MEKEQFDTTVGYCRMLGHEVEFSYCRIVKNGLPCHKVLDCWFEQFPVKDYVDCWYSAGEQVIIFEEPKNRMVTLFDLIQQAKARQQP
ncbi:MAG: hypothetical protein V1793_17055 [Pseudomonadota bacterium]